LPTGLVIVISCTLLCLTRNDVAHRGMRRPEVSASAGALFAVYFLGGKKGENTVSRYLIASLFLAAQATPALAAGNFYVVVDTAGYCAVVESEPSATSDLKIIGDEGGYASKETADKALKDSVNGQCKNVFR